MSGTGAPRTTGTSLSISHSLSRCPVRTLFSHIVGLPQCPKTGANALDPRGERRRDDAPEDRVLRIAGPLEHADVVVTDRRRVLHDLDRECAEDARHRLAATKLRRTSVAR